MSGGSSIGGAPDAASLVAVGTIRKPHGVRGEASVEPLTDDVSRFADLRETWLVSPSRDMVRPATLASHRLHHGRVLLRFEEISTPEEIGRLRGWTVEIAESEIRELEEGEYFYHDLIGLTVFTAEGREVGEVIAVEESPGALLLTVRRVDGGRFDLPFVESICTEVDLESKRLLVALPEGLETLNDPDSELPPPPVEVPLEIPENSPAEGVAPQSPRMRMDVVTIFPRLFDALLSEGVVARATRTGALDIRVWDLRDFATDKHRSTDDEPFGGGAGMVMLAEPVFRCVEAIRNSAGVERPSSGESFGDDGGRARSPAPHGAGQKSPRVIMMSPQGARFDHDHAARLCSESWLIVLCGRYEGFDERIREALVDEELSVGDFVVSGGELPAMLVIDAVSRLVDGVVGRKGSVEADSFADGLLDYPHYTRPAELRGMKVPEVLLSGHAEKIRRWRKEQSLRATLEKRPDLLESAQLDEESKQILQELQKEKPKPRTRH